MGELIVVDQFLQQLRGLLRIARADADDAQRLSPAFVIGGGQQRGEVLARTAIIAEAQRNPRFGRQQRQATVTVLAP